ncbi:MAG TPA: zf-HC2 domain-containing protein [bacterium]|nr:zf-HC2 domain-containing protein [bacterium]
MTHSQILAQADAWRRGRLSPAEKKGMESHLKGCPACRELLAKWPEAKPREGFTGRVMARIPVREPEKGLVPGWGFASLATGLAAVLLVLAAFWHPERKWLEEDKYFSRFDHVPSATVIWKEGSYE